MRTSKHFNKVENPSISSKEIERRELQKQIDEYLANGGSITTVESKTTPRERKEARYAKNKKLSAKEIDRRLKEFQTTGKIIL